MTGSRVVKDEAWMARAACVGLDAELFFPGRGDSAVKAKKVCAGCAVRAECLAYAESPPRETQGIWGGLTTRERRLARRWQRQRAGRPGPSRRFEVVVGEAG